MSPIPGSVLIDRAEHVPRRTISKLVIESKEEAEAVPECSHGKALKFTRMDLKLGKAREFYACSANRDRKICSLFFWVEDWERKVRKGGSAMTSKDELPRVKKTKVDETFEVPALVENSSNAQFLFDSSSVKNLVEILQGQIDVSTARVLCIGTPTVHRRLLDAKMDSTLLDEDERLVESLSQTIRFNMYNGNFFAGSPPADDFNAIVLDPPFHPELLPALFNTLESAFPISLKRSTILFAFPYFNAGALHAAWPALVMTDIRLTYRNHKKYISAERSPVRLFSTKPVTALTDSEYKFCESCQVVVHCSNQHCEACAKCTTITGAGAYTHCVRCAKCVKPTAVHCKTCNGCFLGLHSHKV